MMARYGCRQKSRGFTLVETIVAGGILLSMGLVMTMWLTGAMDLWWTTNAQTYVRNHAQQSMSRMTNELMSATRTAPTRPPNILIPAAPNNTTITFYLPADLDGNGLIIDNIGNTEWNLAGPVQYLLDANARKLLRTQGGQQTVIANDVLSVRFEDAAIDASLYANEVRVTLVVQAKTPQGRNVQAASTEVVRLRN